MKRIAAIGECMLELSAQESAWNLGFAGDTFNTLWMLKGCLAASIEADFVSAFGTDPFSTRQTAFMASHGIGKAASPIIEGARPGLYAISLSANGERSFTYWRADSAARRLAEDPDSLSLSLANRDLIYFSGISLAILTPNGREAVLHAIKAARGAGALIAFDPNFRAQLWASRQDARDAITAGLACAHIVLPTFGDEQALFGDTDLAETANRIARSGPHEIVVKNGEHGCLVVACNGNAGVSIPSRTVAKVLDTTGAGDAFNGAFLAARLSGKDPQTAAAIAHALAAESVQISGALMKAETIEALFSSFLSHESS